MDSFSFLADESPIAIADDKPRVKKMAKGSNVGSVPRKRLADISNMQQPTRLSNEGAKPQQTGFLAAQAYIDQLHKENMTLMKILAERNKLIELNGIELQKRRINLQKAQQQNLQLAKANSSILAFPLIMQELNSGKDRLRLLQHELGCVNALHKARNFVLEDKANILTCHTSGNQIGADKHDEGSKSDEQDKKPCNTNRRRQSKNKFSGSSTVNSVQDKVDNKRLCLRRQSARFKSEEADPSEGRFNREEPAPEPEMALELTQNRRQSARIKSVASKPTKNIFEIDDAKSPVSPLSGKLLHESDPTSSDLSVPKEHQEGNSAQNDQSQETRRRSSGRPLRQAVEKVQSYKEIPLKVKMRREN
ncbi:SHUGOSHIN 2-like isoform X2 [Mangifera indica]|uniref:SHUGOSHIN 2-like isoform X2 n=1 Tax=Mangifera indica TaxID=29780 RepID=UPI001CFBF2E0|nr:SHUGOSHIN 2-like isoform X2 [Mangifera indica]